MVVNCLAFDAFGTLFTLEGVRPRMAVSAEAAEYISEALGKLPLFPGIIEALDDLKEKYPLLFSVKEHPNA